MLTSIKRTGWAVAALGACALAASGVRADDLDNYYQQQLLQQQQAEAAAQQQQQQQYQDQLAAQAAENQRQADEYYYQQQQQLLQQQQADAYAQQQRQQQEQADAQAAENQRQADEYYYWQQEQQRQQEMQRQLEQSAPQGGGAPPAAFAPPPVPVPQVALGPVAPQSTARQWAAWNVQQREALILQAQLRFQAVQRAYLARRSYFPAAYRLQPTYRSYADWRARTAGNTRRGSCAAVDLQRNIRTLPKTISAAVPSPLRRPGETARMTVQLARWPSHASPFSANPPSLNAEGERALDRRVQRVGGRDGRHVVHVRQDDP